MEHRLTEFPKLSFVIIFTIVSVCLIGFECAQAGEPSLTILETDISEFHLDPTNSFRNGREKRQTSCQQCRILPKLNEECERTFPCDSEARYQNFDGRCNNLKNPEWGATNRPYRRLLVPEYQISRNGEQNPRGGLSLSTLPLPRLIRTTVHPERDEPDAALSQVTMSFGHFLAHDIISTKNKASGTCCPHAAFPAVRPAPGHPIVHTQPKPSHLCFQHSIPSSDPIFEQIQCVEFERSNEFCPYSKNHTRSREQENELSSFLDASVVYGSSCATACKLRLWKNGLLRSGKFNFLPQDIKGNFEAGDGRLNQNPPLLAIHTIWMREHNRVATELRKVHPSWGDDELYQAARMIVIAEYQVIVYNEYLKSLFSPETYESYELGVQKRTVYNPKLDPTIPAEMSSAAFRMGHSMISSVQKMVKNGVTQETYMLKNHFFVPHKLMKDNNALEMILEGLVYTPNQKVNPYFSNDVGNFLFDGSPQDLSRLFGPDLVSRNIQRGRDHGIPNYNVVRQFCGLPSVAFGGRHAASVPEGIDATAWNHIKLVYKSVDDIDLYTGGLSEIPLKGGVLGPTFTCILAEQFQRQKFGNRFFVTHQGESGSLTQAQFETIKNRRLSDIFCDNTDMTNLPRFLFLVPSKSRNFPVPCKSGNLIDFSAF